MQYVRTLIDKFCNAKRPWKIWYKEYAEDKKLNVGYQNLQNVVILERL